MFTALNKNPKAFVTQEQGGTGALSLLMKALADVGESGAGISRSAGTAVAEDRLAAMTPEERGSAQVLDKLQGLALTDQFRKRLEKGEQTASTAEAAEKKNIFTTERDKTLNEYRTQGDYRRSSLRKSETKAGASEITEKQKKENELGIVALDKIILSDQTAIAANDTQDGRGLAEKTEAVEQAQRAKYRMLKENGMPEKAARELAFTTSKLTTALFKRISGNVYEDKK